MIISSLIEDLPGGQEVSLVSLPCDEIVTKMQRRTEMFLRQEFGARKVNLYRVCINLVNVEYCMFHLKEMMLL